MAEASFLRSFTFNGQKTSHLFQIEKISIPFLSKENEYYEVGNTDGSNFFHTRVTKNSIKIDGYLLKDNSNMTIYKIKDELVKILNTDEPVKLVFDQLPDRYFNAIFSGSVDHDVTNPDQTSVSLTFDVPDGLAHQIEPSGFTNVYTTEKNLFLDSEFEKIDKYLKPWVFKVDELNNGSAVVSADFTNGVPLNFERDDNQRWLQVNSMTRRKVDNLSKNSSIAFSIDAWVTQIDEEDKDPNAGALILEEWTTDPANIVERHIVPIPKKVGTGFDKFGTVVRIKNPKTTALNLAFGFNGSNIIKWSQPMFTVLEEIPEPVPEPIVGATLFSNSLDFGDYDYSTAPNLLPTLDYSKLSRSTSLLAPPLPYIKDYGDYFILDSTDPLVIGKDKGLFIPLITRLAKGKTYTVSVELMVDDEFGTDFGGTPLYYELSTPSGAVRLVTITPTQECVNKWFRVSKKFTVPSDLSDGDYSPFFRLYQNNKGTGKLYVRYNMMIQEGDQTSSQAPANQMPKITTDKWYAISAVERTEEEGNITSFKYPAKTGINKIVYLQNDRNLIPLLSDKKQYTLSAEIWLEKEVNAPLVYRVNDRNGKGTNVMDVRTINVPAKQWTEVSVTKTIDLPSNPNLITPTVNFPINSLSDPNGGIYFFNTLEEIIIGETYTVSLKGTPTLNKEFHIFLGESPNWQATLRPVEGLKDVWSATFKAVNSTGTSKLSAIALYQKPDSVPDDSVRIDWFKIEKGNTVTPDYPDHWFQLNAPEDYSGIIKIKNDSIKIQEGATTTKPAWKPNLLAEPYEVGDVPVQPNIANKSVTFPINTTEYSIYAKHNITNYEANQKYVITMKATKPATQRFVAFLDWQGTIKAGDFVPVEGLTDVWQTEFTVTQSNIDAGVLNLLNIFQFPSPTKGSVKIDWLKLEKGDKRTPNHDFYKYRGLYSYPSPDPNDYAWEYDPTYYRAIDYEQSREGISDVLLVQNNGTYRTYPKFTFKMNGENGLVGLLNGNGGVLQFGNPEDVDGTTSVRTEQGLNENYWGNTLNPNIKVNTGFKSVYPNMNSNPATPNIIQGSFNMKQDADSVVPVFKGVGDINVWHGPTMMMDIQAPANNDRTGEVAGHIRFTFNNYDKGQRGRIEFSIFDENGDPAMTTIIRDSTTVGNEMRIECWYKGQKLIDQALDRKTFNKTFYEINMDRRGNRLIWRLVQIKKLNTGGQWSTAQIDKEYKFTWNLDEPDTTKWTKLGIWQMRYSNKFHVLMGITDAQVRWEKTPYYQDIKNFFRDGDLVEIDVKGRALYINGSINNDLNIVGNQWEKFVLELGETMIQPVVSEWANMAEVTATIEESYL